MDLLTFVIIYLALTALFVFVLLFGESLAFQGTPVAWLHWLITQGCWQALEWLVLRVCGESCARRLERFLECCCDRPNPVLQISYFFIVLALLAMYWTNLFVLLPNPAAGAYHRYTGTAAVLGCLAVFVAACRSDPGTVTADNAAAHHALYPNRGMEELWPDKECWTCRIQRPARSKHCGVCGRCVARFDHHCGWINNCVGLSNLHLFLFFLIANVALCLYGSVLSCFIMVGELQRYNVLQRRTMNWQTGEAELFAHHPARVMEWLLISYPLCAAVTVFLVLAAILLSAFFFYQLHLIAQGKTQYESYRWFDLHKYRIMEEEQRLKLQQQQQQEGRAGGSSTVRNGRSVMQILAALFWRRPRPQVQLPINSFNRGFWTNLSEVLFWEYHLKAARSAADRGPGASAGKAGDGQVSQTRAATAAAVPKQVSLSPPSVEASQRKGRGGKHEESPGNVRKRATRG